MSGVRARRAALLLAIVAALTLPACGSAPESSVPPPATAAQLRATIGQHMESGNYAAAATVANTLTRRYPQSAEATEIGAQLPAIQAKSNAQAAEREAAVVAAAAEKAKQGARESAAKDARFEGCKDKLKKAQALGVLYDLDWKPPEEPRVVAGQTFFKIPIDAKEGFVETVNCFLMAGSTEELVNFNVLDWQTGKSVGRFSNGRFSMN